MKRIALAVALTLAVAVGIAAETTPNLIAQDSVGLVVIVKEKYGSYEIDTCTVVMIAGENFVLVHRQGVSSWYPASFHSVDIIARLSERRTSAAAADAKDPIAILPALKDVATTALALDD